MSKLSVADVVSAVQALNDDELALLVSSLSSDYENSSKMLNSSSTMGAMCYLFITPADVYRNRKGSIRHQATNSY